HPDRPRPLVLLAADRLVMLEGLGPAVWLLLDEPRTAADVVAHLRAEGAVPEDAEARVAAALAALAEHGLVDVML
ncbi:PqqD family peptide modification chaperone, partial [Micrococcus endophyticus]